LIQIEYNVAGKPVNSGLYDPVYEHDSCGTGFVARIDTTPDHSIVEKGIQVLINLEHRGAIGGDKSTGDGAGLTVQVPHLFFQSHFKERGINLPDSEDYAAGMVFLPAAAQLRDSCKKAFERIVNEEGCEFISWRNVPVNNKDLGLLAKSTQPGIEQIFIARGKTSRELFELRLYIIRRRAEKEIAAWKNFDTSQFYITSLSSRTIVYKGLLTGSQIPLFYPDITDPSFKSPFALIHQRYSTNTLPTWNLAQPFRYIGHNGEINTLRGNINRMRTRESILASDLFGEDIEKIKPVVVEGGSDSAIFDNVLELLVIGGRSIPHAMMMMIPEAYGPRIEMSEDKYAFYEFHSSIMEPWDGPAAMIFTDGRYIGGTLDRNGLRPARYTITRDGLIVMASETGVLDFPAENILRRGRLQPGKMFLVDLIQKRIVPDKEIKSKISRQRPYRRWCNSNRISLRGLFSPSRIPAEDAESLIRKQVAFGYSEEEVKMVISPMVSTGQEAIGSMGNDAALAVLSERPQLLFSYFKQLFAQVTNPPIDPLREEMVMSLESYVGRESNLLEEKPQYFRGLKLPHPVLTPRDIRRIREAERKDLLAKDIDILFPAGKDGTALYAALEIVFEKAKAAIHSGASILILTDRNLDGENCPIPSLLAVAGLNHYLINNGLRNYAGIIVETGEAREVMHFALLVAYGADAVCPYLAFSTIRDLALNNMYDRPITPEEAIDSYITAIKKGLLKTLSRMGISTIHSFFGSQIFEAVGINSTIINKYFCGTASRIEGIGYDEIAQEVYTRHNQAFPEYGNAPKLLDIGGIYHQRVNGEKHHWSANSIYLLQWATRVDNYQIFKQYTKTVNDDNNKTTLRSLLRFKHRKPIPLDQVEPVAAIIKRFSTSPMSFGSISREAHESLAIAMNRLGARSNSGEGGEDPSRFKKLANGDNKNSRVKQVASGRFGVTTEYLVSADELQIKMAQGAKPGEGGQLPGHKVNDEIARVRHTMSGVTLISPPPHHDIYSIEDLSQLIYDLKTVNPEATVSVKLVSEVGVGTIAAGVAKAKADLVLIAGHDGGTGASPLTAIKHTGLPWELGLAETQHALITNRLRNRIRIQVDGLLKTGRDIAIAALLGAEEFGFGTSALVVLGCVMMRKCHLNTCPVGVATQDPRLRAKFQGKPEYVERYMRFLASELREYMAELGFRKLDDMIGQVELLEVNPEIKNHWKAKTLNLDKILSRVSQGKNTILRSKSKTKSMLLESFDSEIIEKCIPAIKNKKSFQINLPIRNIHRAAGARLSGMITRIHGAKGLPEDTIKINLKGSAGQSLGAFLAPGITMRLEGDANDYLAKGMSGGKIIVVPDQASTFTPHENVIIGNVVLYGATAGEVYINGIAGERFAIRNSGAKAVVEGVGDHCCEYMTGGIVVVIGNTGNNFAAGMSGGIAYVYDESQLFDTHCNLDMVDVEYVWNEEDKVQIRTMIENHYGYTSSPRAKILLSDWDTHLPLFVKVMPIDYRKSLERMKLHEDTQRETVSATEEVYSG
jgi:glutamate synthase (NADPH/NADH) large chain